jgi:hypothetical protein
MRFGASSAGSLGLTLLCGTVLFVGCSGDDGGSGDRAGGATSKGGSAGSTTGGTGGSTGGTGGSTGGTGGSTGGTGGSGGMVTDRCVGAMAVDPGLLTDFDAALTGGGFYIYQDKTEGKAGTTTPDATPAVPVITPEEGGYAGKGLHFVGEGFAADSWGAGMGIWLDPCLDPSAATGVSFYVNSDVALRVGVVTPETQSTEFEGTCTLGDSCKNNTVAVADTGGEWAIVELEWTEFAGGTVMPLDPTGVTGIDIGIAPPAGTAAEWGFDVFIDDVSWMGESTGSGGAGGAPAGGAGGEPAAGAGGG